MTTNIGPTTAKRGSSNEWYTPPDVITAVKQVLGYIDLDPASCETANRVVQAERYYTREQNGLMYSWHGKVFCNPPYGKTDQGGASNLEAFTRYLVNEYLLGHVEEAILLIPTNTATSWFALLWQFPICFPTYRIRFYQETGEPSNGVSFGTCFVYLGSHNARFEEVFSKLGHVALPTTSAKPQITKLELWQSIA